MQNEPLVSESTIPVPTSNETTLKKPTLSQPLKSLLSMLLFMVLWLWLIDKWWFCVGLTALVLFHELGHYFVAKHLAIKPKLPIFLPFMGAFVRHEGKNINRSEEAYLAIAGPLLGGISAYLFILVWMQGGSPNWMMLGYMGLIFNLFNLIPVIPLDGSKITQMFGKWTQWIGIGIFTIYCTTTWNLIFGLLWMTILDNLQYVSKKQKFFATLAVGIFGMSMCIVHTPQKDLLMTIIFTALFFGILLMGAYKSWIKEEKTGDVKIISIVDVRPYPTMGIRILWGAAFLALTIFLVVGIYILYPYHPFELLKTLK